MKLGIIADDFTGASDIAGFLALGGLKTIMYNGVPTQEPPVDIDAVVISLKIRSCAPGRAVDEALASLAFLRQWGCTKYYYKYCSTFDSTSEGPPFQNNCGLKWREKNNRWFYLGVEGSL